MRDKGRVERTERKRKGGMKVVTGNKGGGEPLGRNPFCSPLQILSLLLLRLLLETTRCFIPLFSFPPRFLFFLFLRSSFSSLSFSFFLLSLQSTVFSPVTLPVYSFLSFSKISCSPLWLLLLLLLSLPPLVATLLPLSPLLHFHTSLPSPRVNPTPNCCRFK